MQLGNPFRPDTLIHDPFSEYARGKSLFRVTGHPYSWPLFMNRLASCVSVGHMGRAGPGLHPQVDDPEFWSTHLQGRSLMCSGIPFNLCGGVSDCKQSAPEVKLQARRPFDLVHLAPPWRKPVQRSHDLSNVASNKTEAVPVCQQQENTRPALIRRKSTSGLLWINIVINYS